MSGESQEQFEKNPEQSERNTFMPANPEKEILSFKDLLDQETKDYVDQEHQLLARLKELFLQSEADPKRVQQLEDLIVHVDEFFLFVVLGEVKAGKSSFINALVGQKVCKEGAIPTTDKVWILKYAEQIRERVIDDYLIEQYYPFEKLKNLSIVDTPGTNSIVRRHQEIAEDFIPRCDLVLFTTSVDRPFSETEREFLELIVKGWAKKIVFVLTKTDIKEPDELEEIQKYLKNSCLQFFGFEPTVFPVSSKQAYQAKDENNQKLYQDSGFHALEDYLFKELHQREKLKLKLCSPLDAALKLKEQTLEQFEKRLELLKEDATTVETIHGQLEQSQKELNEGSERFLEELEKVLYEFETRGLHWIDDNVTITNIRLLRNPEAFRHAFEVEVVKDFSHKIEEILQACLDWFTKKNLKVWQDTLNYFNQRVDAEKAAGKVIGQISTQFEYRRDTMFEEARSKVQEELNNYDREYQIRTILSRISNSLRLTFGVSLLAVGGAILTVLLASATAIDVTGVIAGITLVGFSLFVLPAKRQKIKRDFSKRLAELRTSLKKLVRKQLEQEAEEAVDRISQVVRPYTDYCERERKKLIGFQAEVLEIKKQNQDLRHQIEQKLKE